MDRIHRIAENQAGSGGSCIISENVLASIAATAAAEVDGVASLAKHTDIKGLFHKKKVTRSVLVQNSPHDTIVDLYLNLRLGARIPVVAGEVQRSVKEAIQNMTGRPVTKVNVRVVGVVFDSQAD